MFLSANPARVPIDQINVMIPWIMASGLIVLVLTCLKIRYFPKFKGAAGEWAVDRGLKKQLDMRHYQVLRNLLLPDGKGGLTQIDHVVVSPFGVFVIETKNWDCWIFGGKDDRDWTLSYQRGGKRKTMNPIHQNEKHVRVVREILQLKPEHCHNVVFINPVSRLKTGPVPGVLMKGLVRHIQSFGVRVFHPEWPAQAVAVLQAASKADDKEAVKAHLAQVKISQEQCYA